MTKEETEVFKVIFQNSILFMNQSITKLVDHDDSGDKPLDRETAIISSVFIQMSLELAIKAFIIKTFGITNILHIDPKFNISEDVLKNLRETGIPQQVIDDLRPLIESDSKKEKTFRKALDRHIGCENTNRFKKKIYEYSVVHKEINYSETIRLFRSNEIKVEKFETLKHFMRNHVDFFDDEMDSIVTEFQRYRNKLVHINYHFDDNELYDIKYDLIYMIIHVLICILSKDEIRISEFYEKYLEKDNFQKLISFPPFSSKMEEFAKNASRNVYDCVFCSQRTYAQDEEVCFSCNYEYLDVYFGFIDCKYCKGHKSVIYDKLNIHAQSDHTLRGLCLNCREDTIVYECPNCNIGYDWEFPKGEMCNNEKCLYD